LLALQDDILSRLVLSMDWQQLRAWAILYKGSRVLHPTLFVQVAEVHRLVFPEPSMHSGNEALTPAMLIACLDCAASNGFVQVAQALLRVAGAEWTVDRSAEAARRGHLSMVQWALATGQPATGTHGSAASPRRGGTSPCCSGRARRTATRPAPATPRRMPPRSERGTSGYSSGCEPSSSPESGTGFAARPRFAAPTRWSCGWPRVRTPGTLRCATARRASGTSGCSVCCTAMAPAGAHAASTPRSRAATSRCSNGCTRRTRTLPGTRTSAARPPLPASCPCSSGCSRTPQRCTTRCASPHSRATCTSSNGPMPRAERCGLIGLCSPAPRRVRDSLASSAEIPTSHAIPVAARGGNLPHGVCARRSRVHSHRRVPLLTGVVRAMRLGTRDGSLRSLSARRGAVGLRRGR